MIVGQTQKLKVIAYFDDYESAVKQIFLPFLILVLHCVKHCIYSCEVKYTQLYYQLYLNFISFTFFHNCEPLYFYLNESIGFAIIVIKPGC